MTAFDLAALLILVVSTLIGFSRGAVRELIAVVGFTVAAAIAVFLLPVTAPAMRHLFHPAWAAAAAAVVGVFVVAYVAVRMLGAAITTHLHASALGGIDRLVGAAFGAVRAIVLLGVFALVFNAVTPKGLQPAWIVGGPAWPAARAAGSALAAVAPKGLSAAGGLGHAMGTNVRKGFGASDAGDATSQDATPQETGGADGQGALSTVRPQTKGKPSKSTAPAYDSRDRRRLDDLVEHAR